LFNPGPGSPRGDRWQEAPQSAVKINRQNPKEHRTIASDLESFFHSTIFSRDDLFTRLERAAIRECGRNAFNLERCNPTVSQTALI
jgi:hypothetical protein